MSTAIQINTGWLIGLIVATLFTIFYPLVLAVVARRRLNVGWRYFGYGALIFTLFQLVTRIPLVIVLQNVFAAQLRSSSVFLNSWLALLALTAGLFEEIGRYVGYRWLMRREEKTWNKAVMYGIGHGGLESMLFVGGQLLLSLVNMITWLVVPLSSFPANVQAQIVQQAATINAQPAWFSLLGGWERLWTLPIQIALSVLVLQVFRRGALIWLFLAILFHALVDAVAVFTSRMLGPGLTTSVILEGIIMLMGLLSVWIIWRLRDRHVQNVGSDGMASAASEPVVPENRV